MKRKAILVGVPKYPHENAFGDLPVAVNDVKLLEKTLIDSRYEVSTITGDNNLFDLSRNSILKHLSNACKNADEDDLLLLYFSGHGLQHNNSDYIAPADASLDFINNLDSQLVPVNLNGAVRESAAKAIIFIIDACREDVQLDLKSATVKSIGDGKGIEETGNSHFITVFSCGQGEFSRFDPENAEDGSYFTRALCRALDPSTPASTLEEVLLETRTQLGIITSEQKKDNQHVHHRLEQKVGGDNPMDLIICEGEESRKLEALGQSAWVAAVSESKLFWGATHAADESTWRLDIQDKLKSHVVDLVTRCWLTFQKAKELSPSNPWREENLPLRILRRIEQLTLPRERRIALNEIETTLLVLAPFVKEAVLAANEIEASIRSATTDLNTDSDSGHIKGALNRIVEAQPQWSRKSERLLEQKKPDDHAAIVNWLLYKVLFRESEVWKTINEGGWLPDELIDEWKPKNESSMIVNNALDISRVLELSRCVGSSIEWIEQRRRHGNIKDVVTMGDGIEQQEMRESVLAYLLSIAGIMGLDVRQFSGVIADHIGLSDPIIPEKIMKKLDNARWIKTGESLALELKDCEHPALDYALQLHLRYLDEIRHRITTECHGTNAALQTLDLLPQHFLDNQIEIKEIDGKPLFQRPHMSFELDRDQILQLLMGEQLYGEPTLAIRELYQNALDACRYREAREKYLQISNNSDPDNVKWRGKIDFRQGIDEQGRAYIECRDNGIGMGLTELRGCFTRAGKRFADTPEFVEEKSRWSQHGIEFYPNSQFGVGVLSYFMLADELLVETCRLSPDGTPENKIVATISGTGSLFRIQNTGPGREAGTTLRLYLSISNRKNDWGSPDPISIIETLSRLLWIAEYETVATQDSETKTWKPNELANVDLYSYFSNTKACIPTGHPDIWWSFPNKRRSYSSDGGQLLSDGILIDMTKHEFLVVNLHHRNRPKLTVDRKRVIQWDSSWPVVELLKRDKDGVPYSHSILKAQDFDFVLLTYIANQSPRLAQSIANALDNYEYTLSARWNRFRYSPEYDNEEKTNQPEPISQILFSDVGLSTFDWRIIDDFHNTPKDINHYVYERYLRDTSNNTNLLMRIRLHQFIDLGMPVPEEVKQKLAIRPPANFSRLYLTDSVILEHLPATEWSPVDLFYAASMLNWSIGAIEDRLQQLNLPGIKIPEVPNVLHDRKANGHEITLLRKCSYSFNEHSLGNKIGISDIIEVSIDTGKIVSDFQSVLELKPLGITVPPVPFSKLDKVMELVLANTSLELVEMIKALEEYRNVAIVMIGLSAQSDMPIAKVINESKPILDILTPYYDFATIAADIDIPEDFIPSEEDLNILEALFSPNSHMASHRIESVFTGEKLAEAAKNLNTSSEDLLQQIEPYSKLGIKLALEETMV